MEVKRPGREVDNAPVCIADAMNVWSCIYTLPYTSLRGVYLSTKKIINAGLP
jgi:hypothetical protein